MARRLATFNRASELNRPAEQQQLFGKGGLTGIGVGDNGKGPAFADLGGNLAHEENILAKAEHSTALQGGPEVS